MIDEFLEHAFESCGIFVLGVLIGIMALVEHIKQVFACRILALYLSFVDFVDPMGDFSWELVEFCRTKYQIYAIDQ